ncbi:MAG TPA: ATP-binding protein [Chloroflexota bacterium]|nr:ATP-binding protein [Chloroflexota bacterium]
MRLVLGFAGALAVATAAGLAFAAYVMGAPAEDVRQLALILAAGGATSLLAGGAVVRFLSARRIGLHLLLAGIHGAVLAVTLLNVLAAALLMFLSTHDLLLLLLVLGFATVLSLLFGYAVSGALVADLGRLGVAARRLAAGDLGTRAGLTGKGEVAQLARAFDQMAAQLQAGIERERAHELARREMVASVSHDLRTPLTTVRAMVEAVTDGVVGEPAEVRRYLGLIRGEVTHLSRLIDDLFELSQIESGALRLELAPAPLSELVAQTLEAYEAPARERGVTLAHEADAALPPVHVDAERLMRVLRNLIDNALRYTPSGGTVAVEARADPPEGGARRHAHVTVSDTGPGLPEGESERVFERFFRSARSRTRADGGSSGAGLGLTIARGLVQAHGGRMWAEQTPGAGARFHFTLPLAV